MRMFLGRLSGLRRRPWWFQDLTLSAVEHLVAFVAGAELVPRGMVPILESLGHRSLSLDGCPREAPKGLMQKDQLSGYLIKAPV